MLKCRWMLPLACSLGFAFCGQPAASGQNATGKLNANDVSFLWPLPTKPDDVKQLIAADSTVGEVSSTLWPNDVFQQVIAKVPGVAPVGEEKLKVRFPPDAQIEKLNTWKVAGIRIDPSAPGCDSRLITAVGSTPQVRLILQPVTIGQSGVRVHDFAAHLAFDFTKSRVSQSPTGQVIPAVPDTDAFRTIVAELVALKQALHEKGISTEVAMGVHPGFSDSNVGLTERIRKLLVNHLRPERLNNVAFMGVRRPEPWVLMILQRTPQGFEVVPQRVSAGSPASMFKVPKSVVPPPSPQTFGAFGVSTASLLRGTTQLDENATTDIVPGIGRAPKIGEIPDIVANPRLASVLNTDCVSCHTESSLRRTMQLPASPEFAFVPPQGFAGIRSEVVADGIWNVRNYGWGVDGGRTMPTIAMRTANEAAESAEFINREYLSAPSSPTTTLTEATDVKPVSNPLTLVVTAKSGEDYEQLKEKIRAMQELPPSANPIFQALERLGIVHDARFVFLANNQLAVITTYDDDFDRYIDLFVDEIGDVFNVILAHVKDAPAGRVQDNREAFRQFVRAHDVAPTGVMYSAYPRLRVQDIKDVKANAGAEE